MHLFLMNVNNYDCISSNIEKKKSETGESRYSIILDLESMYSDSSRDNMNVDFFMALKNFNDRIWTDK